MLCKPAVKRALEGLTVRGTVVVDVIDRQELDMGLAATSTERAAVGFEHSQLDAAVPSNRPLGVEFQVPQTKADAALANRGNAFDAPACLASGGSDPPGSGLLDRSMTSAEVGTIKRFRTAVDRANAETLALGS